MPTSLYTRRLQIRHPHELEAGDLVDVSDTLDPQWATVEYTTEHGGDPDLELTTDPCDGGCIAVIVFEADDCLYPMHVQDADEVYARFLADTTFTA
jgi:hypothetical protein